MIGDNNARNWYVDSQLLALDSLIFLIRATRGVTGSFKETQKNPALEIPCRAIVSAMKNENFHGDCTGMLQKAEAPLTFILSGRECRDAQRMSTADGQEASPLSDEAITGLLSARTKKWYARWPLTGIAAGIAGDS